MQGQFCVFAWCHEGDWNLWSIKRESSTNNQCVIADRSTVAFWIQFFLPIVRKSSREDLCKSHSFVSTLLRANWMRFWPPLRDFETGDMAACEVIAIGVLHFLGASTFSNPPRQRERTLDERNVSNEEDLSISKQEQLLQIHASSPAASWLTSRAATPQNKQMQQETAQKDTRGISCVSGKTYMKERALVKRKEERGSVKPTRQ